MTTAPTPAEPPVDDSAVFTEQARWLLEWHNRRSEAFATRAVAVLGFDGVVMGLLLQGTGISGLDPNPAIWVFLIATAVLLLVSAGYAVGTIVPATVAMPSVGALRQGWADHRRDQTGHYASPLLAESLLNSTNLTGPSPVAIASDEATTRAGRFTIAVSGLLAALVFLAILAVLLLAQI